MPFPIPSNAKFTTFPALSKVSEAKANFLVKESNANENASIGLTPADNSFTTLVTNSPIAPAIAKNGATTTSPRSPAAPINDQKPLSNNVIPPTPSFTTEKNPPKTFVRFSKFFADKLKPDVALATNSSTVTKGSMDALGNTFFHASPIAPKTLLSPLPILISISIDGIRTRISPSAIPLRSNPARFFIVNVRDRIIILSIIWNNGSNPALMSFITSLIELNICRMFS